MLKKNTLAYQPLELVLIGGAYKSGTSLLCEQVEAVGYANPAFLTNGREQGHGLLVKRYLTRECALARAWNRQLARATPREMEIIERSLAAYLLDLIGALGSKLVLKDPYMKITAECWFRAARTIGAKELRLLLTTRPERAVERSLANSKFLTCERKTNAAQFRMLIEPPRPAFIRSLSALSIRVVTLDYHDICGRRIDLARAVGAQSKIESAGHCWPAPLRESGPVTVPGFLPQASPYVWTATSS